MVLQIHEQYLPGSFIGHTVNGANGVDRLKGTFSLESNKAISVRDHKVSGIAGQCFRIRKSNEIAIDMCRRTTSKTWIHLHNYNIETSLANVFQIYTIENPEDTVHSWNDLLSSLNHHWLTNHPKFLKTGCQVILQREILRILQFGSL